MLFAAGTVLRVRLNGIGFGDEKGREGTSFNGETEARSGVRALPFEAGNGLHGLAVEAEVQTHRAGPVRGWTFRTLPGEARFPWAILGQNAHYK
jgi:hypothetical protein